MSTPEAAWPEGLIDDTAKDLALGRALFRSPRSGATEFLHSEYCDVVQEVLDSIAAWRDPKGEPAVVRANKFYEQIEIWSAAHRKEWQRAEAAEAERDALRKRVGFLEALLARADDTAIPAQEFRRQARAALAGVDHGE